MEVETIVVNGSHDLETDPNEKILKPRTPKSSVVSSKEHNIVLQNGNSESGSVSDITESNAIENGHAEDTSKQNGNGTLIEENDQEVKASTPRKLRRESRKESTPKPEIPIKRELRRRETTPKASTPKKNSVPAVSNDPPKEKVREESKSQIIDGQDSNIKKHKGDDCQIKSSGTTELEESVIILEESRENEIIAINESVETKDTNAVEKSTSIFSVFSISSKRNSSIERKESVEVSTSSPSIICLDSPISNYSYTPSKEIKGRKPINSCSKFPGRTVSIISLDSSTKRKADDDSFDNSMKKRFAGDIESTSEKSPGWRFFSSSWSPVQNAPKPPHSSTPFHKLADSMAVNYDENTNLSITASDVKETSSSKTEPGKWCSIM